MCHIVGHSGKGILNTALQDIGLYKRWDDDRIQELFDRRI